MENIKVFKALSNRSRIEILKRLKNKDSICACKFLEEMDLSQSTISHHLKVLADCDLVNCRKEGRWHHYSLNETMINEIIEFFGSLTSDLTCIGGDCSCDS